MKQLEASYGARNIIGQLSAAIWTPDGGVGGRIIWSKNLLQYDGANLMAALLSGESRAPNAMYLEYWNGAEGDWAIPDVGRSGAAAYYASLETIGDHDFLRVPLMVSPSRSTSGANYENNVVTFLSMTSGVAGVWASHSR